MWRHTANNSAVASRIAQNVNGTSYDDTTGAAGTIYFYWVKAVNAGGTSGFSNSDSGNRKATPPPPPQPPTGLAASDGVYADKVRVTWNAPANATSYEVWRHTANNSAVAGRIAQNVNGTSYDDTPGAAGTIYFYWVKAVNAGGTSGFSNSDSGNRSGGIQDPARFARHVDAPLQNDAAHRSVTTYAGVIDQFNVQSNPRYALYDGYTYCNIFLWDVTRAMGAEIPHWFDNSNGQPIPDGRHQSEQDLEMNVSRMIPWLAKYGNSFGWTKISTASAAQAWANNGKPVIAIGMLTTSNYHVAIVRPGTLDPQKGPATAQAGAANFNFGNVSTGFGKTFASYVEYWGHP